VVGYVLYFGVASRTYTNSVSAGNSTTATASGLVSGSTYYFAATAVDAAGFESAFGNEVSYQAPSGGACSITLSNLTQTYDGAPKPVSVTTIPAGLGCNVSYSGVSTAPINAGTYTVVAAITATNYSGSVTNTLVIAKANTTVNLGDLTQTFDGTPKPVTVTTVPAGLAVVVTYNGSTSAPTKDGTYQVLATVNDLNCAGSANGTLTILKKRGHHIGALVQISSNTGPEYLLINWPPTTNNVLIEESVDLVTWAALTNTLGASGALPVSKQSGAHFFRGTSQTPAASQALPLSIKMP
jgi:hypothetical protein